MGDYGRANRSYNEVLEVARQLGDRRIEGISLFNIGDVLHKMREDEGAVEFATRGLALVESADRGLADSLRSQLAVWRISVPE